MRLATRRHGESCFSALRFAVVLGAVFGIVAGAVMIKPPLAGAFFGFVSAVVDFTVATALIGAVEIFLPRTRLVAQCNRLSAARGEHCALNLPVARPFDLYAAQVSFDYLASPEGRAFIKALPTGFKLPAETIDRLRDAGRRLLREDPQFRKLLENLKS